MGAVKGTGQSAVEEIVRARQTGPFTSLFDFCRRIDRHSVNRRSIEALIRAGAFDAIEPNRAALIASLPTAVEAADQAERSANQVSLFSDDSDQVVAVELAKASAWDLRTRLTEEKLALGYFFSGHLFDAWRDEVRQFVSKPLSRVEPSRDLQWIAGVICATRTMMGRRGKMLFVTLDDGSAQLEVAVYAEMIDQHRNRLKEDQLLIVQVKVSNDEYSGGMRVAADSIFDLQLAREARARSLRIRLNGNADAVMLKRILNPYRSAPANGFPGTPVELVYTTKQAACVVRLGDAWRVRLPDELVTQLSNWVAPADIEVTY